ncbi:MAG: C39 family peptidase [Thermodesulfobacteriota bacterium]
MRLSVSFLILAVLAAALTAGAPPAEAGNVVVPIFRDKVYPKQVETLKERRLRQVVHQSEDFSCGAAALATILHCHYGAPVNERDAIVGMFKEGNKEKIQQVGFSMLDMKRFSETIGYKAQGFRLPDANELKTLDVPAITLIDTNRYKHFVVIRKVTDRNVYLADPSWGNRRMSLQDFQKVWNQIILVITGPTLQTAEGLFAGDYQLALAKNDVIRTEGLLGPRFVMDPSFNLIQAAKIPMSPGIGFISSSIFNNP